MTYHMHSMIQWKRSPKGISKLHKINETSTKYHRTQRQAKRWPNRERLAILRMAWGLQRTFSNVTGHRTERKEPHAERDSRAGNSEALQCHASGDRLKTYRHARCLRGSEWDEKIVKEDEKSYVFRWYRGPRKLKECNTDGEEKGQEVGGRTCDKVDGGDGEVEGWVGHIRHRSHWNIWKRRGGWHGWCSCGRHLLSARLHHRRVTVCASDHIYPPETWQSSEKQHRIKVSILTYRHLVIGNIRWGAMELRSGKEKRHKLTDIIIVQTYANTAKC